MLVSHLQRLTQDATYRDLALRCQEFLYYHDHAPRLGHDEHRQLAEDTLYNLLVEYLIGTGMPRPQAEQFCNQRDHLVELALRIASILGPSAHGASPWPAS
ncbi:hypothetical protein GFS31_39820 [Leptolyngbya sp. BL0902]|uniref:hypothetical protein n=1 Tax=Leptolyngbya sp. BL0902 TaxID=1115757 RepID=UPI0018E73D1C|nr:hypothetical protein [Leptolyngbya sp. BL0902]QQE67269.1 hypothetical protein GFS31_39820 [Leptolyngbya sp. BL0902]